MHAFVKAAKQRLLWATVHQGSSNIPLMTTKDTGKNVIIECLCIMLMNYIIQQNVL